MDKPKILVIIASIREGRYGGKIARWFLQAVEGQDVAELELVDLRDYPLLLFHDQALPSLRQGPHPDPAVQRWLAKIESGDGYIFVTAEYNHNIPGAFKNAIDYGYKEWNEKPLGLVSYGSAAGGARAAEALRLVAGELKMYDVRDQVVIPNISHAFDEQDRLVNGERLAKTARLVVEEVAGLARKLKGK